MLEEDPTAPKVDDTGDQLLKHARVYTLAEKFGVPGLRSLASSKIHCVNSTAKGEIAYARYVYQYTTNEDKTIRAPVASFWAARSHTLRSEAEAEFKALCLEYPQFGYDILSRFLVFLSAGLSRTRFADPLSLYSARPRREAQARALREDAPLLGRRLRPQTRAPQQRRRRLSSARDISCTLVRSSSWDMGENIRRWRAVRICLPHWQGASC